MKQSNNGSQRFSGNILYGLPVRPGTEQTDRLSPAFDTDYFRIEERSMDMLLAMSVQFASRLRFYNEKNKEHGDWSPLFNDETALMASILSFDSAADKESFLRLVETDLEQASAKILKIAEQMEAWLAKVNTLKGGGGETLADHIRGASGPLLDKLNNFFACLQAQISRPGYLDAEQLAQSFPLLLRAAAAQQRRPDNDIPTVPSSLLEKRIVLADAHASFQQAVAYLKPLLLPLWNESLQSGRHEPGLGLFLAFLKLYQKTAERINLFTQRHLDFYYWEILKAQARPPQPDSVHIVCRAAAGNTTFIPKGSLFSAGSAGQERLYGADNDLQVTDARVASLLTLSFERNVLASPARELGCFTRCRVNDLSSAAEPLNGAELPLLPLFGEDGKITASYSSKDAQLGLAVASPELLFSKGRRQIELTLCCCEKAETEELLKKIEASGSEEDFFSAFGQLLSRHLLQPKQKIPVSVCRRILKAARYCNIGRSSRRVIFTLCKESTKGNALFFRFFRNVFWIDLTGEQGWLPVERYEVFPSVEPGDFGLRIAFTLNADRGSTVGCRPELHGFGYDTDLPLIRLRLNHQANFFAYSLLQHFSLRKVILKTKAQGISDLLLWNQHGQLDATVPFQPFGPLVGQHSYLIFGSYEAARKQLTSLTFNLVWSGLPDDQDGFGQYYRDYDGQFSNKAFNVDLSYLRNGDWYPENKAHRRIFPLFSWLDADGRLLARHQIELKNLKGFQPLDARVDQEQFALGPKIGNGFLKWEFVGPPTVFGHAQYPSLLTKVLTANARRRKRPNPLPNPPYTPLLSQLTVDYTSHCEIDLSKHPDKGQEETIFHIHPFGIETIYPCLIKKQHALLPVHDHAGNLFIGLRGQNLSGIQTLYFQLHEDSEHSTIGTPNRIDWYYAAADGWHQFKALEIQADTTNNLLVSGIVTLNIPDDISADNKEMGQKGYWLRASTNNDPQRFSSLRGVYAHALRATCSEAGDTVKIGANAVKGLFSAVPGLTEVLQPEESFHGRPLESRAAVITRTSERLRHKDRAVTPWDYERLVLEHFSSIHLVKCFPHMQTRPKPAYTPGRVLIVVVPDIKEKKKIAATDLQLRANASLLAEIHAFLAQRSSQFIQLEVRNPEYEYIQVRCAVTRKSHSVGSGILLDRINQEIIDYISPWNESGWKVSFGWSLRLDDLLAYLSGLDEVEYVTDLSVLHITANHQNEFYLADSGRDQTEYKGSGNLILPRYPWSIAMPMSKHFLQTIDRADDIAAEPTGVDELEIGATFIINE
ncbi:hypothetical protein [Candidatus Electronema sp. PJ]|uniref:hypothetical protein n=1 Tax=Candidatus Electronema sp. PJ TaxID=3401572 RepID=UPI003AA7DCDF